MSPNSNSSEANRQAHRLLETLSCCTDSQQKLSHLVKFARQLPLMPEDQRSDTHLITGCSSKLWLTGKLSEGRCQFECESDSMVVKGIAGLLCGLNSGLLPREVQQDRSDPLLDVGVTQHLSPSRQNGLGRVQDRIRELARRLGGPLERTPLHGLCDAHNHLQDERFGGHQETLLHEAGQAGVSRMVVNGSCESDWLAVANLARQNTAVIPSYGYHPWYLGERTPLWKETLLGFLRDPFAGVGEIGLDRWIPKPDINAQEEAFVWQWRVGCDLARPLSLHCLKAWGWLETVLKKEPRSPRGFLLHSYGGPAEMIPEFVRMGAYFGFPGYFLHDRKLRQREVFRTVPKDRLLLETDAPDQVPPASARPLKCPEESACGHLNHPGNLGAICEELARFLGEPPEDLALRTRQNFEQLFVSPGTP
ncbi:MAG: hypothetical protein FJ405_06660 [Verrucomicrobia bacterium]|nr:hypothetical protein [Verrucomicrobiota bacterium]